MKTFKRELSLLLVAALVISSIIIGVGTVSVHAYDQAAGQLGYYRFEVKTGPPSCGSEGGTANDCLVTISYSDATNWTYTIPGEGSPNYFENNNTDNIYFPLAPAKPISSITINSTGGDMWDIDWANFYYSYDFGGNWARIASMGVKKDVHSASFTYPSDYSLNTSSLNKTLTFNANGGTGGKQIYSESGATLPVSNIPIVTRTGYTFAGWTPAVPNGGPSTDTTYTAQWTPNSVNITFDANGGTGGTGPTAMQIDSALTPPTVARTDYTFLNWLPEVPAAVPITDATYTAQWRETNPAVTFDSYGGSAVEALNPGYGNSASKPADPVKAGFTFGGWYWETALTTAVYWPITVTQSISLYARWNAENSYTIIFDANSGTGGTSAVMPAGDPLTAPAVAKTGYTLAGWSPEVPAAAPAENIIYTAQWSANTYTVNYDGNGNDAGSTAGSSHTYDITSTLTANGFTKVGNSFLGWSADQSAATAAYTDSQSVMNLTPNQGEVITFYAVWSINWYNIIFNANGGTGGTSSSKMYNTALTAPTVTKTGYTFANWSPEVPAAVPAANATYTAQWTANQYLVTFDPQGGSVTPATSTVTYDSTYGTGSGGWPTPTRNGYTFGGWYTGTNGSGSNSLSTSTVTTASNHTLYAKWTGISYTVAYNGNGSTGGSTASSAHTYDTAKALTANGYTNTGLAFEGWATSADGNVVYTDKQSVLNLTETSGTIITLYAKWTYVNIATVTFDANGGTGGTSTNLIIGATLTVPTVTRTGYTFAGWSPAVPDTVPAGNTTYTAQWTANQYLVTFDPQSGTVSPTSSNVTYGSTYGAGTGGFPTPNRAGYSFGGWYTSPGGTGTKIFDITVVTITTWQTLYAKWIAYTIDQATGQTAYYRLRVTTSGQDCGGTGTANNLTVTINYSDGTSTNANTIAGESSPNYFEAGNTDTIVLSPMLPAKPISSITYNSSGGDRWKTNSSYIDYSYDYGTNFVQIASMGGFDGTGVKAFTYPSTYSLNTSSLNKTLTFNANGGTGGKQVYSEQGATLPASNIPAVTRTGYTFAGWSPAVPTTGPSTDTTYTAQWTSNNINITFDANGGTGGTGPTVMQVGSALTAPSVERTAYTFLNWLPAVPTTVPNIDTTYSAQWIENPTITFNSNGGSEVGAITSAYNASVLRPADPVKDGYNFGEWFLESELTTPVIWPYTVTHNTNLYARWNAENSYTIIFDANGGTGGTGAAWPAGEPLTAPAVTKTGYTLAGWSPEVPAAAPAENTVYTAQWAANTYSVSYDGNGNDAGSTVSSLHTYDIASALTANGFTKVGNTLIGWSVNAGATAPTYTDGQSVMNLTQNQGAVITFYAVWSANYYTITFSANGGSGGTSSSKQYGTALTAPTVTRTGYTFANWSPAVPATVPASTATYTAQWTANQYVVTFDPQGGTVSPTTSTVTYGSTYGAGTGGFPTPARTGYTFGGWYTGTNGSGSSRSSTTTVSTASNHTLYAKWTGITYTVAYNSNGSPGGSTSNSTHTYGTAKTLTANGYTNTGYAFVGWATSADGDVVYSDKQSVINLTESSGVTINLYAKWTNVNVATITFDANGGNGGKSTTLIIGAPLFAPTVVKTGYTFVSWSPTLPASVPTADTTYTAQWTGITSIVTFNPNGGTVSPTSSTVTYDSTYGEGTGGFPTPVRTGYTFDGWYFNAGGTGTQVLSTSTVTIINAMTFYAKWIAPSVTITFNANGGTGGSSTTMTVGAVLTAPTVTRTGHTFTGWSPSVPPVVPGVNTTYTAQWTANTYTVTFNPQSGTVSPTSSTVTYGSTYGAGTGGWPTPVRTGYTFGGWNRNASGTGTDILSTTTVALTGSQTLYAKWTDNPDYSYTVTASKAKITKYLGSGGNVTIPNMLGGFPVIEIDSLAFNDCTAITSITFPDSLTTIDSNSFNRCTGITTLTIPDSVVIIGGYAFSGCTNLTTITFGSGLKEIGGHAFDRCFLLNNVVIPGSVTDIGSLAFYSCTALTQISIPDSVTTLETGVFSDCTALTEVTLPNNLTSIADNVFNGCTNLAGIAIPSSVTSIGDFSFADCVKLESANIPNGITRVEDHVFYNCSSLKSITIPDSIVEIGSSAFEYCSGLTKITVPGNVSSIESRAFNYCTGLAGAYFWGAPPTLISWDTPPVVSANVFTNCASGFTVYHFAGQTGFTSPTWCGYPTAVFAPTGQSLITFDANGGTGGTGPTVMTSGDALTAPAVTRTGYTFTGWSPAVPPVVPEESATYTAQWTANQYTITFDANGGTGGNVTTLTFGATLTAPAVTRAGYTFAGWLPAVPPVVPELNTTYTAQWTPDATANVAVDINLELGRYAGGIFTPLTPGEALHTNDIITVRIAPTSDFLCGVTRYIVMFSKSCFQVMGSGKAAFTPNTANAFYASVCNDYNGATSIPQSAWPAALVTDGSYAANSAIAVSNSSTTAAPNGGYPGYLPGEWLFRFDLKVTQDIANGSGAKVWMDNRWLRKPDYKAGQMYFYKCLDPTKLSTTGSSTLYNFNLELSGANISVEPDANTITFDANGGTGGTSAQMTYGTALTPPVVAKAGYLFAGWSPSVPAAVPAQNATYTAQYYPMPAVQVIKLAEGFKVNIKDWAADYKYQIWSLQKITSDLFSGETASQWILSKAYTPGSSGTAEPDGSISFTIAGFTSSDSNYTIAVRIADANNNYIDEIRDTYTPEDVQEVKITKVLVDGEYSEGIVLKAHDASSPTVFTVIGNNVPGTVYTARVSETGAMLAASSTINFSWDTSALTPGTYTVQFTGTNGATWDTRNISVQLYSLDTGIQYGNISSLVLTADGVNTLPKALTIDPDFTNGSFYYSVAEPGRKAIFTSGLFQPADSIEYTFTKYGVYQVSGYVNREYEVKIGSNFDDGYIKQFVVSRSQTEPSSVELAASADITKPVDKATPLLFTASADIGGIGSTPVQYSFWRYDAKGYVLVKDWSSENTLDWTPARVGNYTIQVRAKGADAGSYEAAKSVQVTVTDGTDQIAQNVVITLNEAELNANATARAPITVKASAASSNSEDLLYKFYVTDTAMGTSTLQSYSADSDCIWTPRKAGTYTISVLVKNTASYGAYDAMETFEITVN